ncbi:MAG: XdhC family protein [Hyphomicrobiales bacterium]|nr:XdhC family protein [Hyphomicrobiales bacterium]
MAKKTEQLIDLIADLRRRDEEFCVVTVVRTKDATSAKAGAKALVTGDGEIHGHVGGSCVTGATRSVAAEVLKTGVPRLIRIKPTDCVVERLDADGVEQYKSGCPSGGTVDLFIEPMRRAPRLVVCGAAPVAVALAELGAVMGYRIAVAAKAEDHGRFAGIDEMIDGFDLGPLDISKRDFITVATQGKGDRDALSAAVASPAAYVALVGSRRKAEVLRGRLREMGIAEELIARLHAPAGLDIAAIEPNEIALSILGEIVQVRRSGVRNAAAVVAAASAE